MVGGIVINILALEDGTCVIPPECKINPILSIIKQGVFPIIQLIIFVFGLVYLIKIIVHLVKLKKAKEKYKKTEKKMIKKIIIKMIIVFFIYVLFITSNYVIGKYIDTLKNKQPQYCTMIWC